MPLSKPGLKIRLKWPFESNNIQRNLEIVGKRTAILQLALSAFQTRMLREQGQNRDKFESNAKRTQIPKWLKSSDPEQNHKLSRSRHEPQTATWILNMGKYQSWENSRGQALWLHGIPGAGKTILCSTIIDHIQTQFRDDQSTCVAYYYFDFAEKQKQTVLGLLKSLVYQLLCVSQPISDDAAALYSNHQDGLEEPSPNELLELFLAEVGRVERVFILIDGLDECPVDERQIFFSDFLKCLPPNASLFITSRREPDIEATLGDAFSYTICIQSSFIDADVRTHVNSVMSRDPVLLRWKPAIREEILESIVNGAHGM